MFRKHNRRLTDHQELQAAALEAVARTELNFDSLKLMGRAMLPNGDHQCSFGWSVEYSPQTMFPLATMRLRDASVTVASAHGRLDHRERVHSSEWQVHCVHIEDLVSHCPAALRH